MEEGKRQSCQDKRPSLSKQLLDHVYKYTHSEPTFISMNSILEKHQPYHHHHQQQQQQQQPFSPKYNTTNTSNHNTITHTSIHLNQKMKNNCKEKDVKLMHDWLNEHYDETCDSFHICIQMSTTSTLSSHRAEIDNTKSLLYYGVNVKKFVQELYTLCKVKQLGKENVSHAIHHLHSVIAHFIENEKQMQYNYIQKLKSNLQKNNRLNTNNLNSMCIRERICLNAQYIATYQAIIVLIFFYEYLRVVFIRQMEHKRRRDLLSKVDPLNPVKRTRIALMFLEVARFYSSQTDENRCDSLYQFVYRTLCSINSFEQCFPLTLLYLFLKLNLPVPENLSEVHARFLNDKSRIRQMLSIEQTRMQVSNVTSNDCQPIPTIGNVSSIHKKRKQSDNNLKQEDDDDDDDECIKIEESTDIIQDNNRREHKVREQTFNQSLLVQDRSQINFSKFWKKKKQTKKVKSPLFIQSIFFILCHDY
jgi:hypothetical protein